MTVRCPSCNESFAVAREDEGRATVPCRRCGRVVVIAGAARPATADDPQTEPCLEPPDPEISPRHAAIECHGERIVLRDLGSKAGTFVGDDRVGQREIDDQTEFRLAGTTFLLLVADD